MMYLGTKHTFEILLHDSKTKSTPQVKSLMTVLQCTRITQLTENANRDTTPSDEKQHTDVIVIRTTTTQYLQEHADGMCL